MLLVSKLSLAIVICCKKYYDEFCKWIRIPTAQRQGTSFDLWWQIRHHRQQDFDFDFIWKKQTKSPNLIVSNKLSSQLLFIQFNLIHSVLHVRRSIIYLVKSSPAIRSFNSYFHRRIHTRIRSQTFSTESMAGRTSSSAKLYFSSGEPPS